MGLEQGQGEDQGLGGRVLASPGKGNQLVANLFGGEPFSPLRKLEQAPEEVPPRGPLLAGLDPSFDFASELGPKVSKAKVARKGQPERPRGRILNPGVEKLEHALRPDLELGEVLEAGVLDQDPGPQGGREAKHLPAKVRGGPGLTRGDRRGDEVGEDPLDLGCEPGDLLLVEFSLEEASSGPPALPRAGREAIALNQL